MHKDRTIVIASDLLALCGRYDALLNSVYIDREYFFQSPNGSPYTAGWIQNQFWKCWDIAGITGFHGSHPRVINILYLKILS